MCRLASEDFGFGRGHTRLQLSVAGADPFSILAHATALARRELRSRRGASPRRRRSCPLTEGDASTPEARARLDKWCVIFHMPVPSGEAVDDPRAAARRGLRAAARRDPRRDAGGRRAAARRRAVLVAGHQPDPDPRGPGAPGGLRPRRERAQPLHARGAAGPPRRPGRLPGRRGAARAGGDPGRGARVERRARRHGGGQRALLRRAGERRRRRGGRRRRRLPRRPRPRRGQRRDRALARAADAAAAAPGAPALRVAGRAPVGRAARGHRRALRRGRRGGRRRRPSRENWLSLGTLIDRSFT